MPLVNPHLVETWKASTAIGCGGVVLYGGRGSSKTKDAACRAVYLMDRVARSGGYMRFLCTRRYQVRIKESVYQELVWAIEHLGLSSQFEILSNSIRHVLNKKAEFIFLGIEKNHEDIKGLSDIDIVWLEEAQNITEEQWDVIEPTLRKAGCQIWIIFNPKFVTDFAWKRFVMNTPRGWVKRKINYDENPFLEPEYLVKIADKRAEDEAKYEHIYKGVPLGDGEYSIFKRAWLDACIDADKVLGINLTGRNIIGFDPADDGEDKCAKAFKFGGSFVKVVDWKASKDELSQNASLIWADARKHNALISYDTIGVGAFAGSHFNDENLRHKANVQHFKFDAGGGVFNPDYPSDPHDKDSLKNRDKYLNIKAQAWANTARKAMMTYNAVARGVSIRPEDVLSFSSSIGEKELDALFVEMCVPWWIEAEGKDRVVPKRVLKKDMGVKSHNLADAVIAADNINIVEHPKPIFGSYSGARR